MAKNHADLEPLTAQEHSRTMLLAGQVSDLQRGALIDHMNNSTVAVSVDLTLAGSLLCARTLLTTLRRMPCQLALDPVGLTEDVINDLAQRVIEIDPERGIDVRSVSETDALVSLHVGTYGGRRGYVRLIPEGHGGHVVGSESVELKPSRTPSPLGSVYVAALGAGEAFKRLAQVKEDRKVDHAHLTFCPVSLSPDLNRAPDLPHELTIDLALFGVGAVGTGHALLLSEMPWRGQVGLVDSERFETENRGTYSLGTDDDTRSPPYKVDLAASVLTRYQVTGHRRTALEYIAEMDSLLARFPSIVLSGLDSIESRHDTQRVWPDHLIDAATGDTTVGLHHATRGGPCLMCFLRRLTGGPSSLQRLSESTGLSVESLREDAPLTEDDIATLTDDQRKRLTEHLGRPKCGLARAFGLSDLDSEGYRPSVPFVSLQAACLGIGRLVAVVAGVQPDSNFFQYDALLGPLADAAELRLRESSCYCVAREATIEEIRRIRRTRSS